MPQHYTQDTTGVLKWCNTCRKQTIHGVSGKRIGRCNEHSPAGLSKRQEKAREELERAEREPTLF